MNKTEVFLRKHSSTILAFVGATGVVATSVLAVKATPKALTLLEEAKKEKGDELTAAEAVKVAWKPYIPAVITGLSTITCIFGANYLNTKNQASLMSAYAVLDSSYREYRKQVMDMYEKDADINIKQQVIKTKFDKNMELDEDKELFFDYQSMRYFESTFNEVVRAERTFNQNFTMSGFACLNEYYDILGIPRVDYGDQLGWSAFSGNEINGLTELEFEYEKVTLDDGLECWIITMPYPPTTDYFY